MSNWIQHIKLWHVHHCANRSQLDAKMEQLEQTPKVSLGGKQWIAPSVILVVMMIGFLLSGVAKAESSQCNAVDLYSIQEFDAAIKCLLDIKSSESETMLALCYAERYALYNGKDDKEALAALQKSLKKTLSVVDLEIVARLVAISVNPHGAKVAEELLASLLSGVSSLEDMKYVIAVIIMKPSTVGTASAIDALHRHLVRVREYVSSGGTMPERERELFQRKDLIEMLADILGDNKNASLAQRCLVLIEEPALAALESRRGEKMQETVENIRSAMAKRMEKRPGSAWYGTAQ